MPSLRTSVSPDAYVSRGATFLEAARTLVAQELSAIAVLDDERRVAGLFTHDDLLAGLFPGYLAELKHTAFLREDLDALAARAETAGDDPVTKHMRRPLTVDADASPAHVAERFLHCEWGAVAVVERDRFVGMLEEAAFCREILGRIRESPPPPATGASGASAA
jgi:CBS domain-containing protein